MDGRLLEQADQCRRELRVDQKSHILLVRLLGRLKHRMIGLSSGKLECRENVFRLQKWEVSKNFRFLNPGGK